MPCSGWVRLTDSSNSSTGGAAVLDHDQARLTVGTEVLGVADFGRGDDAMGLEEAIVESPIVGPIFVPRVQQVSKVAGGELAA